jgi:hypothetical protein
MSNDLEKAIDNLSKALDKLYKVLPIVEDESLPEEHQRYACEDCISRQAVKDMLTSEWTKYMPMELDMNLSFVLDKISALPSVTPKTKWIPVSERLPEDLQQVLVTISDGKKLLMVTTCMYSTPPGSFWNDYVTAWMPLPEPYKEE